MDWNAANAIASSLSALTTGGLGVVAWRQAKQLAYRDIVSHYHEMASKIYPVVRKHLTEECNPTTYLLGSNLGNYIGGGPTAMWWPELKEQQPGWVQQLPPNLLSKMKELHATELSLDALQRKTYDRVQAIFATVCEPKSRQVDISLGGPMIEVTPQGVIEGASVHTLWARSESLDRWLERSAEGRTDAPRRVAIQVIEKGGNTRGVANGTEAIALVNVALENASRDSFLVDVRARATAAAQLAAAALTLLEQEAAKTPQRRRLWPGTA